MDWKELGGKIADIAPTIGGAVGGPVGAVAGMAASLIAKAFGLKTDATADEIANVITTDPESRLKLIVAENDFKIKMREKDIDELRAMLADVQSARLRETEVVKATGKKDWNLYLTAWVIIVGFFALTLYLMEVKLPEGSSEVIFMLFGALATGFATVLGYFFGSSRGSAEKSRIMEEKMK